jgi:hypothetical protein
LTGTIADERPPLDRSRVIGRRRQIRSFPCRSPEAIHAESAGADLALLGLASALPGEECARGTRRVPQKLRLV